MVRSWWTMLADASQEAVGHEVSSFNNTWQNGLASTSAGGSGSGGGGGGGGGCGSGPATTTTTTTTTTSTGMSSCSDATTITTTATTSTEQPPPPPPPTAAPRSAPPLPPTSCLTLSRRSIGLGSSEGVTVRWCFPPHRTTPQDWLGLYAAGQSFILL
ncbi:hypothetical protein Pmani_001144 [Petrolisthes manimaculis]|uniref:Uncharacterized protein n=1 Tax=Petrolisthes manimaculis TaxID=1843537 RepID=A0AAE1QMT6_9EUCA|nr:hypothetical protein Pmani_001144 [Petrolisthes manimaculis]